MKKELDSGGTIAGDDIVFLRQAAILLRILDADASAVLGEASHNLIEVIDEALYKLDVIPAGLVLGQAAYECGWSRLGGALDGGVSSARYTDTATTAV